MNDILKILYELELKCVKNQLIEYKQKNLELHETIDDYETDKSYLDITIDLISDSYLNVDAQNKIIFLLEYEKQNIYNNICRLKQKLTKNEELIKKCKCNKWYFLRQIRKSD